VRSPIDVVVIGGGFAGVAAAARLARRSKLNVTLLDPKAACEMLPLLPDIAGRRLTSAAGQTSHRAIAARHGYRYIQHAALELDRAARRLTTTEHRALPYDFLLLAHGGHAAFYGNESAERHAIPLRTLADALRVRRSVSAAAQRTFLVVGGGYTGIELATHVHRACALCARGAPRGARSREGTAAPATAGSPSPRVIIVEAADEILGMQEPWMRRWALTHLKQLGIEVRTGTTVETVEPGAATLSDGTRLTETTTLWTAGMRVHPIPGSPAANGRLAVDEHLQLGDGVFVAGDAAAFTHKGALLPPASYIAVQQGRRAAQNIERAAAGRPLLPYRPLLHGFVIPVAGGSGCGRIHGLPLTGRPAAAVHYSAAAARAHSFAQRCAILRDLARSPS